MLRPQGFTLDTDHSVNYSYDTAGRLHTVSDPQAGNFTYGYLAGTAALLETLTGPAHTVTNTYEPNRNILDTKVNSKLDNTVLSSYDYTVNSIGQRTNVARTGTAFAAPSPITWGYDPLGQVSEVDHANATEDQSYQYDGIGNRSTTTVNGYTRTYTVNTLNQYNRLDNSIRSHDEDGNLARAYSRDYFWDGENRLFRYTDEDSNIVYFGYDYLGRRYVKSFEEFGFDKITTYTTYDSWNPVADYKSQTLINTRTWGMDLSGSIQGAGGVGGLLTETQISNESASSESYMPTYDGNGNVSEYIDSTGETVAHYEYNAFGKIIGQSGALFYNFEHKFSTKRQDSETGLYYYGYRYYDPEVGRWLNRDPIEEEGGYNLYGFIGNDGLNWIDYLGNNPFGSGSGNFLDPNFDPDFDPRAASNNCSCGAKRSNSQKVFEEQNCGNQSYRASVSNNIGFSLFGISFGGSRSTTVTVNACKKMTVTADFEEVCVCTKNRRGQNLKRWAYSSFKGFSPNETDADCN